MADYKTPGYRRCVTTLSKNTRLNGTLSFSSSLQIEGFFKGIIDAEGFLGVGDESEIRAEIHAKGAAIAGKVSGDVHVHDKLELLSTASVKGNVKASKFRFQDKMELIGECIMLQDPGSVDIFSASTDKLKTNLENG